MKIALKTRTIDVKTIEIEHLGVKREILLMMPYGLMANAPNDSFISAFCQDDEIDSINGYPFDPINIDSLEDTEIAIGIPTKDARIKFKSGGTINIRVGSDDSTDFAVRYNELKTQLDQMQENLNNHLHTNAGSGFTLVDSTGGACSGSVGTPTVPSNVDFSNCKVSKINLPSVSED